MVRIAIGIILIFLFVISYSGSTLAKSIVPSSSRSISAIQRVTPRLENDLASKGFSLGDPLFIRIMKSDKPKSGNLSSGRLEVYLRGSNGRFKLYKTLPICAASGKQGPKTKSGDRQSPEGFYFINAGRFNPSSQFHLSLNMGYPNAYDRAHGYTGDYLMIHGNCVSIGCYAMTVPVIEEIYTLAQAAVENGQNIIRVHSFPFPMTDQNLKRVETSTHYAFWKNLQQGWSWFELNGTPPDVRVSAKKYTFHPLPAQP